MTTNFFHPSLLLLFLDPGSEIRDPGWVKIRIRDKHPGSATLRNIQVNLKKFCGLEMNIQIKEACQLDRTFKSRCECVHLPVEVLSMKVVLSGDPAHIHHGGVLSRKHPANT
jgi:hypothetical protein